MSFPSNIKKKSIPYQIVVDSIQMTWSAHANHIERLA